MFHSVTPWLKKGMKIETNINLKKNERTIRS